MATYAGFDGYVQVGTTVVGGMRHWSVSITGETLETSAFNPTASTTAAKRFRSYIAGPLSWTASFDGFMDATDTGQNAIVDAVNDGNEVTAYFHLDGSRYYKGTGILTSESPDMAWDGVSTVSWDMQGTGLIEKTGWS